MFLASSESWKTRLNHNMEKILFKRHKASTKLETYSFLKDYIILLILLRLLLLLYSNYIDLHEMLAILLLPPLYV